MATKKFKLGPRQRRWLRALKPGGGFRHGTWKLEIPAHGRKKARHCCLGVLCVIEGVKRRVVDGKVRFSGETEVLPKGLVRGLGLRGEDGRFDDENESLVHINDAARSYAPIIELMEKSPERIFTKSA